MLTREQIEEIKTRLSKATRGEWVSYVEGRDHLSGSNFTMTGVGTTRGSDIELLGASVDDQDFIANARQDIEILIDEIERLWAAEKQRD